jgi:hypothetical protein
MFESYSYQSYHISPDLIVVIPGLLRVSEQHFRSGTKQSALPASNERERALSGKYYFGYLDSSFMLRFICFWDSFGFHAR